MPDDKKENSHWRLLLIAIVGLILIILAVGFTPTIVYQWAELGAEARGQFGDQFGMTNALFSGLAFLGVIIAISLQSQELAAQRKELKLSHEELMLTRMEMKLSRDEMKSHGKTMELQRFENTFFHLLDGIKREKNNITCTMPKSKKKIQGDECVAVIWQAMQDDQNVKNTTSPSHVCSLTAGFQESLLHNFFSFSEQTQIILKFLSDQKIADSSNIYADSLNVIFSYEERCLLFYETRFSPGWDDIDEALVNKITKERLCKNDFTNPDHFDWPIWSKESGNAI